MSNLLLIPRIEINHYNVMQSQWLVSPTPIMAISLFIHNLELKVGCKVDGVAIVHHDYVYHWEEKDPYGHSFHQRRGSVFINRQDNARNSVEPNTVAMQPVATGRLIISLILNIISDEINYDSLNQFLNTAKIAGGNIVSYNHIPKKFIASNDIWRYIKSGFLVMERLDLMQVKGKQLDSLLNTIRYKDRSVEVVNSEDSWIVATTLGYAGITEIKYKPGVRGSFKHMFVEPLVGLIQYVSIRKQRELPLQFWRYKWNPSNNTFICSQTL
jgi:CRISPR-associated protein Csy2